MASPRTTRKQPAPKPLPEPIEELLDTALADFDEAIEEASLELTPQFSANTPVEPKIGAPKRRAGLIEAPTFGIVRGVYCSEEDELNRTQQP